MPIEAPAPAVVPVRVPGRSYVDLRDTLNRLGRVLVTGPTAVGWLAVLDPTIVREISDEELAALVGGSIATSPTYVDTGLYPWTGLYPNGHLPLPPPIVITPGAFGSGPFGGGPFGG